MFPPHIATLFKKNLVPKCLQQHVVRRVRSGEYRVTQSHRELKWAMKTMFINTLPMGPFNKTHVGAGVVLDLVAMRHEFDIDN